MAKRLTLNCANGEIVIGYPGSPPFGLVIDLEVTSPDGTVQTFYDPSLPYTFPYAIDGIYTFVYNEGSGVTITDFIDAKCSDECKNIAWIYDCIYTLNERYEELKCVNEKSAAIEKIKLDRVMQLFKLIEHICECGEIADARMSSSTRKIDEYVIEIQSIANCYGCDKKLPSFPVDSYGCTDPSATNYDPTATSDDGSCTYISSCLQVTMPGAILKSDTNVPDDAFESFLENNGMGNGTVGDDTVCTANIYQQLTLDCQSQTPPISDMTGIEDFVDLDYLNCFLNNITILDLSDNTALDKVQCSNNILTSIDLSQNTLLTNFECAWNNLQTINLSQNILLEHCRCHRNNLTGLNISANTVLEYLGCHNNDIQSLDVSSNTLLWHLTCSYNLLTSLDVSNNTSLVGLNCGDNELPSLDLSNNTALTSLNCPVNQLTSLDLRNGNNLNMSVTAIGNPNLTTVYVDNVTDANNLVTSGDWFVDSIVTFSV